MCPDPYVNKLLSADMPCSEKSPVTGRMKCVLHARAEQRGLELAPFPSRALLKNEIHELILTLEETASPGKVVNRIAYVGFFEVADGGILWAGDEVYINGERIGTLAGYDLTHFPNHFNIVIKSQGTLNTGKESGYHTGAEIIFKFPGDK
jgi:hypothetical protein